MQPYNITHIELSDLLDESRIEHIRRLLDKLTLRLRLDVSGMQLDSRVRNLNMFFDRLTNFYDKEFKFSKINEAMNNTPVLLCKAFLHLQKLESELSIRFSKDLDFNHQCYKYVMLALLCNVIKDHAEIATFKIAIISRNKLITVNRDQKGNVASIDITKLQWADIHANPEDEYTYILDSFITSLKPYLYMLDRTFDRIVSYIKQEDKVSNDYDESIYYRDIKLANLVLKRYILPITNLYY